MWWFIGILIILIILGVAMKGKCFLAVFEVIGEVLENIFD